MFEHETGKRSESRYEKEHTAYVMNCGAEFRGRQEGRVKNGVKKSEGEQGYPPKPLLVFILQFG